MLISIITFYIVIPQICFQVVDIMDTGTFIELIVGGVPYITSKETLTKYPESLFPKLLTGGASCVKSTTCFLDRDGQLFRHILNFLRTGMLCLPGSFDEHAQLRLEAEFYGLPALVRELDLQVNAKVIHIELQEHWLNWDCTNLANGPLYDLRHISPFKEFFETDEIAKDAIKQREGQIVGADTFPLGRGSTVRVEWAEKLQKAGWTFRNQSTAGFGNTEHWIYCTTDCWTYKVKTTLSTSNGNS
jgi:hypothetical protein